ncbi:histidinol-phosphatase HisJ family protein [Parasporobacterium paucivorans]|uniref:Histidinol-phosphatase n=1 Tax=Parasporobacterium paucivorans DSM 15970 TaxID=1122934 RepID=A0A1M6DLX3_9FIRM|nr:histidinol-phosphatase HisJ family protein [Parasporobacterium paucivorans]SHI74202.1 histidinol-phosphatase (PHP family) [Parasporobacterium paucivorans DSM 15970]
MYSDTHIHTRFSPDSDADLEEIIQKALSLDMKHICITDHQDFDYPVPHLFFDLDLPEYYETLCKFRKKYAGRIELLIGVETGLEPGLQKKIRDFTGLVPFDFIIGSSHLVNGHDPYYPDYFDGRTEREAFAEYFTSILDNLNANKDFDVYGHLDYIVRYAPQKNANYSYADYADYLDEILKTLIRMDKGIEVNTGGYRYELNDTNPSQDIIKRYRQLGGDIITIGSDAHTPDYIGYNFDLAAATLKNSGFRHYNIFRQRSPVFIGL